MRVAFCAFAAAALAGGAFGQTPEKDLAALKDSAAKIEALRKEGGQDPAKRSELGKLAREFTSGIDAFAEAHLKGELTPALAKMLVEVDGTPGLNQLSGKLIEQRFESGDCKAVVGDLDALAKAGLPAASQQRLDGARAIAMFASGKDDEALELAKKAAESQGKNGIKSIDVAAAILASRGAYDDARALYDAFANTHGDQNNANYHETKRKMLGKPAPEIEIAHWVGPKGAESEGIASLASMKGKVVVLDFWQTWCPPCRAVMPGLSKAQERMQEHGVQVLGLCRIDGKGGYDWAKQASVPKEEIEGEKYPAHVAKFSADMGLSYLCGIAKDPKNNEAYGVRGIPTLAIVDPSGNVAWMTIGSGVGVDALIETLCLRLAKRASGSR